MASFAFTAPSITTPLTDVAGRLQGQASRYRQEDFLNEIVDAINKATKKAGKKVGKISGISDILSTVNMLASLIPQYKPFSPIVEAGIGAGETYFTDKAMKGAEKGIDKQVSRGYLSSTLPEYLEDFKQGRKDKLTSNIMDALTSTALSGYSAYKGGAYDNLFSKGVSPEDVLSQGLKGKFGSSDVMGLQPISGKGMHYDQRFQAPMDVLESILKRGTAPQVSPYAELGIGA